MVSILHDTVRYLTDNLINPVGGFPSFTASRVLFSLEYTRVGRFFTTPLVDKYMIRQKRLERQKTASRRFSFIGILRYCLHRIFAIVKGYQHE